MPTVVTQNDAAFLSAIFDDSPLPSFIIPVDTLQIKAANKKAAALLQYNPAALPVFTLPELLDPRDGPHFVQWLQQPAPGWSPVWNLLKGNGGTVAASLLASAFTHEDGTYYQVVAAPADAVDTEANTPTESCPLQKIKLIASLVKESEDILTAADLEYRPVTWNAAAERIYGISAAQAIGNYMSRLLHLEYVGTSREAVREVIAQQGHWRGEMVFTRPTDGKKVTLLASFKKLHDEHQRHIGYLMCGTDITTRKEAELRLKETESRFRGMANAAPVGIWMSDTANRLTYVNKVLLDFTGLAADDFSNAGWAARVHPDDLQNTKETFIKSFWQKKDVTLKYRFQNREGSFRWMQDTGIPRFLDNGTFVGYIGSIIDIHDSKQREEQLQYQAWVLENVQDIVISTDLNFKVTSWNRAAERHYGIKSKAAVGRPMRRIVNLQLENTTNEQAVQELEQNGIWKGEAVFTNAQGEKRYFLHTVSYFVDAAGNRTGILDVGRDITDRRKGAEQLKQSELFYRNLIADSLDGILLCDTAANITFVAPSIKNILGYDIPELVGKNCFDYVHPDDAAWALQSYQKEVLESPEIKSIVVRLRKRDGSWLWCMVRGHNLLANPHVRSMVIYFHDDTVRKQASQAVKESERRFRNLISDLQVGVILNSAEGKTIMCNRAMCQMMMVPEEELIGKSIYEVLSDDFIHEDGTYMPTEQRPLFRVMNQKEVLKDVVLGFRQRGTGERIWVLVNADPILDEKGDILHIICTVKEITDRKRLEQELLDKQISHQKALTQATIDGQEKERREIGKELHDNIGQQLTTIKLFLDMAKTTTDEPTAEMVSLALKGVSDVINEVRTMSHALVPPILGDIGIIESIEAMVENIRYAQLLKIDFDYFDFNEDRVPENVQLMLYRIIQEGLNNIVKHADATHVQIVIKNIKKQLTLELKDNGKGFHVAKVRKGLGLTNIKNRASLFGGKVAIESTPGAGCLLRVVISVAAAS